MGQFFLQLLQLFSRHSHVAKRKDIAFFLPDDAVGGSYKDNFFATFPGQLNFATFPSSAQLPALITLKWLNLPNDWPGGIVPA